MYLSQPTFDPEKVILEICRRFESPTVTSHQVYLFLTSWFEDYFGSSLDESDSLRGLFFEGIPEEKLTSVDVFPLYREIIKLDLGDGKIEMIGFPLILMEIYG